MKKIIVVEDDRLLGKEVSEELDEAGFEVLWAREAVDVFEALEAQEVGLVFLDIMLPGDMDGYEILRKLKADEKYKDIPVVMLSNLGQTKEIDKAMDLGAADYMVKASIDLDRVVEMAKKYLQE